MAFLVATALWWWIPAPTLKALIVEGGPIERPTEWFYFAAAALAWVWRRPGDAWRTTLAISLVMLAFGAREMDLHKHWTGTTMLRASFYYSDAPLEHRLWSLAVVTVVAWAMGSLVWRHARAVWSGVRRADTVCTSVAIFMATLVFTKALDRSINVLAEDFGVMVPAVTGGLISAWEEIGELSLPLVALLALWQHSRRR